MLLLELPRKIDCGLLQNQLKIFGINLPEKI
jgi:hypothetical protein